MKNNSSLAAHFAKRNTKNCGGEKRSGESEGGQKFLPPNLPFCPPERKNFNQNSKSGFSSKKVRTLSYNCTKKEGFKAFFFCSSAPSRDRTCDIPLKRRLLYRLSYGRVDILDFWILNRKSSFVNFSSGGGWDWTTDLSVMSATL